MIKGVTAHRTNKPFAIDHYLKLKRIDLVQRDLAENEQPETCLYCSVLRRLSPLV